MDSRNPNAIPDGSQPQPHLEDGSAYRQLSPNPPKEGVWLAS